MAFSAEFLALIAAPGRRRIYLAEVTGFDTIPAAGSETRSESTLYFTTDSQGYMRDTDGQLYTSGLLEPGRLIRSLTATGDGVRLGGLVTPDRGDVVVANTDGRFDHLKRYTFDGRRLRVLAGGYDPPAGALPERPWGYARMQSVLDGSMHSAVVSDELVTFLAGDARLHYEQPLQRNVYGGFGSSININGAQTVDGASNYGTQPETTVELRLRVIDTNSGSVYVPLHLYDSGAAITDWRVGVNSNGTLEVLSTNRGFATFTTASSYNDGLWHHIAIRLTSAGKRVDVLIDGVQAYSAAATTYTSRPSAVLHITGLSLSGFFEIDEVRLWSILRSDDEIRAAMHRPIDAGTTGLWHYYDANTGSGTTLFDGVASGPINMTLSGATWVSSYEGDPEIAGQAKPRLFGEFKNAEAVLIDKQRLIFQFNDGPVQAVDAVEWQGVVKTLTTDYTVNRERGCITVVSATPSGRVNVYGKGDASGGYIVRAPELARHIATGWKSLTGDCLDFDGSNDDVSFGDNFDQTSSFTLQVWIYPTTLSDYRFIAAKTDFLSGWELFVHGNGTIQANLFGLSAFPNSPVGTIKPNRWQCVTLVVDRTAQTNTIYVGDAQVAQNTGVTGSMAGNAAALRVGSRGSDYFKGRIDRPVIWNSALTTAQWQAAMFLPVERIGTTYGSVVPQAAWEFDDRSGSTAVAAVGGVNGTVSGATWVNSEAIAPMQVDAASYSTARTALAGAAVAHRFAELGTSKLAAISDVLASNNLWLAPRHPEGTLFFGRIAPPWFGRFGTGFAVNGLRQYMKDETTTAPSGGDFTAEGWICPQRVDGTRIFCKNTDSKLFSLEVYFGRLRARIGNGTTAHQVTITGTTILLPGHWHHVAVTHRNNAATKLYVDGVLEATGAGVNVTGGTKNGIHIGGSGTTGYNTDDFWIGCGDDIRVWQGALTAAGINNRMDRELTSADTAPAELGEDGAQPQLLIYESFGGAYSFGIDVLLHVNPSLGASTHFCPAVDWTVQVIGEKAMRPIASYNARSRVRLAYDHNWAVLNDGEIAGSVTAAKRKWLTTEDRFVFSANSRVVEEHKIIEDLQVDARFAKRLDAEAEAYRQGLIFGHRRSAHEFTWPGYAHVVQLGQGVRVIHPRQFPRGRDFLVTDAADDGNDAKLKVWG